MFRGDREMRLIDADNIKMGKALTTECEYNMGWNDAIDAIDENEPTVEAIPVYWIAMYLNKLKKQKEMEDEFIMTEEAGYGINYSYYYARGIMKMVEEWEEGK